MKLEVGKSYKDRNGDKIDIVHCNDDDTWPFIDHKGYRYQKNGRFKHDDINSEFDLIGLWGKPAEVVAEKSSEIPPAFKSYSADDPLAGPIEGMTLRDYFAAAALQGMGHVISPYAYEPPVLDTVAAQAYKVADAMLKARQL